MLWPCDASSVGSQLPKPKKPIAIRMFAVVSITTRRRQAGANRLARGAVSSARSTSTATSCSVGAGVGAPAEPKHLRSRAVTMANLLTGYALHTYQSELFPSAIRARAVGFVYSWSRLAVVFSSLTIGSLLQTGGANAVLLFLGATQVAVAVLVAVMGPRTLAIRDARAPA